MVRQHTCRLSPSPAHASTVPLEGEDILLLLCADHFITFGRVRLAKHVIGVVDCVGCIIFGLHRRECHGVTGYLPNRSVGANHSEYFFFASPPFVGNDGKLIQNKNNTVTVDIRPVVLSVPASPYSTLDHVKNLVFQKNYWAINSSQVLSCELRTLSTAFGRANNPFGRPAVTDASNDICLGSCGLIMLDTKSFVVADFFQSARLN